MDDQPPPTVAASYCELCHELHLSRVPIKERKREKACQNCMKLVMMITLPRREMTLVVASYRLGGWDAVDALPFVVDRGPESSAYVPKDERLAAARVHNKEPEW